MAVILNGVRTRGVRTQSKDPFVAYPGGPRCSEKCRSSFAPCRQARGIFVSLEQGKTSSNGKLEYV